MEDKATLASDLSAIGVTKQQGRAENVLPFFQGGIGIDYRQIILQDQQSLESQGAAGKEAPQIFLAGLELAGIDGRFGGFLIDLFDQLHGQLGGVHRGLGLVAARLLGGSLQRGQGFLGGHLRAAGG